MVEAAIIGLFILVDKLKHNALHQFLFRSVFYF